METVAIVYGVIILIQSFFLFWFGTMIKAQKSVVDSFKAQSDSLKNFQEMVLNQIDPKTFQDTVNYQVRGKELEYKDEIEELKETNKLGKEKAEKLITTLQECRNSFYTLVGMSALFKLFHSNQFGKVASILKLKKFELDEIEIVRDKLAEMSVSVKD